MTESTSAAAALLKPILDAWLHRDEMKAAKAAGSLTFWRSGMLKQLEAIANGTATAKTMIELRKNFKETQNSVNETMIRLNELRGKLAGSKVARQIDLILNDFHYGKSMIRSEIETILEFGLAERDRARHVCNSIQTLNSELERLHRMVHDK
jgi:hypothetical protein